MEAARKSEATPGAQPPGDNAAAAPKLQIEKYADGGIACLKFSGMIDESFEGKKIAKSIQCETLVLDLGGVKKISSFGIREWVDFMQTAVKQAKSTVLIECAPKVVDQLNMVANFAGGGRVFSFYAPFRCDYCDSEQRVLLEVNKDWEAIKSMKLADRPCPSCKESMYFDEDGSTYFSYILTQGAFELENDLINFLATKLDYRVGTIEQKVRVDKVIEGRVTYLRLAGDLNNTFPREKLAEGVEGTVILDVGGVPRVEPAGAAEWRGFMQQATPLAEQLYLVGVQPAFLEKLCTKEDLGIRGTVVDFQLPYACSSCGTTSNQTIDVATHYDVLKFATAPELRCPSCKAAMVCQATEATMTVLPGLPKVNIAKDFERQIGMLKARKFDHKKAAGLAPVKGELQKRSAVVPILLVLLLVVAGAAGVVYFMKQRAADEPGPYGAGPLAASSAKARPEWININSTPGATSCKEDGGGLTCVGVSNLSPSQEDAEDEASEAAIESIAFELAKRISDKEWNETVPSIYLPARDAKLAAMNRDQNSTQARREVRDGRRAVSQAIKGVTPSARYWESFSGRDGRKFLAFVQVKLPASDAKKLVDAYTERTTALGATTVPFYPLLAWKYPKLTRGAVIVNLEPGPLQDIGVSEHFIVLAVDGRDTPDAQSFAKIVTEEHKLLVERGGFLRLLVQADSGDPREFSKTLAGKLIQVPVDTVKHQGGRNTGGSGPNTGGVNVWDRFGGNKSGGRDDPTQ